MSTPKRRASDRMFEDFLRLRDILLNGHIDFASVVLGFAMMVWATLGQFHQADIAWFAKDFAFQWSGAVWTTVYYVCGFMFVYLPLRTYPPVLTLVFSTFCISLFSMIAVSRPSASFTSGWTLNVVVIFMAAVLAQRSGVRRAS